MAEAVAPPTPEEKPASRAEEIDTLDATSTTETIQAAIAALTDREKAEKMEQMLKNFNPNGTHSTKVTFKTFDAKDPKMSGHLWMWQTEGLIQQYGLSDAQALAQVRSALVGDPGRWFSCVLQDEDNKDTQITKWSYFKQEFKKRYMKTENFTQQLKMFQACKQRSDEPVTTFHDRIVQITKRMLSETKNALPLKNKQGGKSQTTEWKKEGIEMTQEIYQKMLFISGLQDHVRLHMEENTKQTDSLGEILERATKFERAQYQSAPHLASTTSDVAAFGQRPQKFPGKPSSVIVDGVKKVLCLRCGNYGHMQYSCPKAGAAQPRQTQRGGQTNRRSQYNQQQQRYTTPANRGQGYRRASWGRGNRGQRTGGRQPRAAAIANDEVLTFENQSSEN